ncbi:MAG: sensor histidine kinase [Candidatus Geothermincolia bacterium]
MNLRRSLIKLTLGYLILIMLVTGLLSFALYKVGTRPFEGRLEMRQHIVEEFFPGEMPPRFETEVLQDAKRRLALFLVYFNIGALCLAGLVSYGLAKRELKPMQDAFEMQSRFTSDAAHELRTPLTAMKTEIEVALRGGEIEGAETRELLASNLEEIGKLEALSSSLLKLAQYEEAAERGEVGALELGAVLEEAVDRVKRSASGREITIALESAGMLVRGDRPSLVELFVILLDNSIKYSMDATTIRVSATAFKRHALVSVTDHGYGISPEDLEHVFDRFYRGQAQSSSEQVAGHGLGLSIAKRIAEIHHGSIELESEVGAGTTVTVKLPLAH